MKRMRVADRGMWVHRQYAKLHYDLTCRFGAFNRDKLLRELERKLRNERIKC